MDEIIKQIRAGHFNMSDYVIVLDGSLVKIWVCNGNYKFYPDGGTRFTWKEKREIRKALKEGIIKKALTINK